MNKENPVSYDISGPWMDQLDIDAGDHVIALVSKHRDVDVLPQYLRETQPRTRPGVVVGGPHEQKDAELRLVEAGMEDLSSRIHFHNPLEIGMVDGSFDAEHFLAQTGREIDRLVTQGANRVHHCGLMRWIQHADVSDDECVYLEARINQVVENSDCISGMCIYDVRYIGSHLLVQLLRTHPKVLLDDRFVENPFYERPEDVIRELGRSP